MNLKKEAGNALNATTNAYAISLIIVNLIRKLYSETPLKAKLSWKKLFFERSISTLVKDEVFLYQICSFDVLGSGYFIYEFFSHLINSFAISRTVFG